MASIPPSELAYQEQHIDQNRGPMTIGVCSMFLVLAFGAVAARLASRRISRVRLGSDDYLILVALVCPKYRMNFGHY